MNTEIACKIQIADTDDCGQNKDYKKNPDIKWNFTKFVVGRKGNVVARFEPTEKMEKVAACVASLI